MGDPKKSQPSQKPTQKPAGAKPNQNKPGEKKR